MANIIAEPFGKISDGTECKLFTITNAKGNQLKICDYGCRVQSWIVKDKDGKPTDIVLGFDNAAKYEEDDSCMGGVIGRHANRIRYGKAVINGKEYQLELNANEGKNHIHGGSKAFHYHLWQSEITEEGLKLTHVSPDGTAGYPGNMTVTATFNLTDEDELSITYEAVCDKDTVCNLTNHAYFNLDGFQASDVLEQKLQIFADEITEHDEDSFPTGVIRKVEGTPMDFRQLTAIGARIDDKYDQLIWGRGYDHNYIIPDWQKDGNLRKAAYAESDKTGITMTAYTTLPGVQLYTANYQCYAIKGKNGIAYGPRSGFCLETQYFPNSLEHAHFPQPILLKGEVYKAKTVYKAGIK